MTVKRLLFVFVFLALIFTSQAGSARSLADQTGTIELVSVATDGTIGNGYSEMSSISANGRYVAFESSSSNLVDGDSNGIDDVFVRDRQTGITELVSVSSAGEQVNGYSTFQPVISADGRFVGFTSDAANLVDGDTNGEYDVFVHDRQTGTTELVSVALDGTIGNGSSNMSSISADGRFVAFNSWASNLVRRDTNGKSDVFVRDRLRGTTKRVSVASDGAQGWNRSGGGSLSADGRYVAFWSLSNNLINGDTNRGGDIFVHDRITGITKRVSVASDGSQGNRESDHTNQPFISADGRFVAFVSDYMNLVVGGAPNTRNIFLHDRLTGTTELISMASDGTQGKDWSFTPSISADGRFVAFWSVAPQLVERDTNRRSDVFVRDRQTGITERITISPSGEQFGGGRPMISSDGRYVTFASGGWYEEGVQAGGLYVYTRPGE